MDGWCVVLIAHGSRDPRWREPFEKLAAALEADLGAGRVRLAYLDFVAPTLLDAVAQCARDGVSRLRVLPLFMSGGGHVDRDIPAQIAAAQAQFPRLMIEALPPIGEHPRLFALMAEIARGYAQG